MDEEFGLKENEVNNFPPIGGDISYEDETLCDQSLLGLDHGAQE